MATTECMVVENPKDDSAGAAAMAAACGGGGMGFTEGMGGMGF